MARKEQSKPRRFVDDLVTTIEDDDSDVEEEVGEVEEIQAIAVPDEKPIGKKRKADDSHADESRKKLRDMDPDFDFQVDDGLTVIDELDAWATSTQPTGAGKDINEIIARRKQERKDETSLDDEADDQDDDESEAGSDFDDEMDDDDLLADDAFGVNVESDEDEHDGEGGEDSEEDSEDQDHQDNASENETAAPVAHPDDLVLDQSSDDDAEDVEETKKRNDFFAPESNELPDGPATKTGDTFLDMGLARPILKGLNSASLTHPTPIQRRAIPVAMTGKDVVGSAVTGSGKTAAFVIPILERLLYRSRDVTKTRVVILMPTRELALQCFTVATKLASFTDITFGQAIGGLNQKEQERALRLRPDIVIATPGRFIDFMRNTSALAVDGIEILVLDEADRMLEDGFADELNEILTTIPKSRQTMLFSATMTSSVDNLIRAGLTRPIRLSVDSNKQTVTGLTQEFVRLRPGREKYRLGCLLYLCKTAYTSRTIIFFRQKAHAHRVRVIFALLDLSAAELHGSMSQDQRINAMESFRSGRADYLLATDLASRGLDIKNVEAVINYEAPQSHEIYLHRVGRTARAGKTGKSCTLAAEPDRKIVKQAVKSARENGAIIKQCTVPPADAESWQARIDALDDEIEAVLKEEKEEKVLAQTEVQMKRADNMMVHQKEIMSRPAKTWFQGEKDKAAAREKGREALNGPRSNTDGQSIGDTRSSKPKGKLSNKQKKKLDDRDERKEGKMFKKGKADREGTNKKSGGAGNGKGHGKGKGKGKGKMGGKKGS